MTMKLSFSRIKTRSGKRRALTLVAAALVSAVAVAAAIDGLATMTPPKGAPAGAATDAVFTGRYANGVPVYLLPPLTVIGSRKSEVARIERGQQRAQATYGRAGEPARREN